MIPVTLLNAYRKVLSDQMKGWSDSTGRGGAENWEDYQKRVGIVRGLETALTLFNEQVKKHINEDDDSD